MENLLELLRNHSTRTGQVVSTLVVALVVYILYRVAESLVERRVHDAIQRYYGRKAVSYLAIAVVVVAFAIIWSLSPGRVGVVLGVMAAGVAFAMQEVIGALAGWVNIVIGGIYRVGDRVEMGEGVRGDVIDITPLRTKLIEIGSPIGDDGEANESNPTSWVRGRQFTGRIVAISNKMTFTEPVFNYTSGFEYIWEELHFPISYRSDWQAAERIIREEAERVSTSAGAQEAMSSLYRRYPIPRAEVEPRVFVRATDNWMELAARFVVSARTARSVKDEMTRRIYSRLQEEGISIASATMEATIFLPEGDRG